MGDLAQSARPVAKELCTHIVLVTLSQSRWVRDSNFYAAPTANDDNTPLRNLVDKVPKIATDTLFPFGSGIHSGKGICLRQTPKFDPGSVKSKTTKSETTGKTKAKSKDADVSEENGEIGDHSVSEIDLQNLFLEKQRGRIVYVNNDNKRNAYTIAKNKAIAVRAAVAAATNDLNGPKTWKVKYGSHSVENLHAFNSVEPSIINDVILETLANNHSCVVDMGKTMISSILFSFLTLVNNDQECWIAYGAYLFDDLCTKLCRSCHDKQWRKMLGGVIGLQELIRTLPERWVFNNELQIVKALLFAIKHFPSEVRYHLKGRAMSLLLETLEGCHKVPAKFTTTRTSTAVHLVASKAAAEFVPSKPKSTIEALHVTSDNRVAHSENIRKGSESEVAKASVTDTSPTPTHMATNAAILDGKSESADSEDVSSSHTSSRRSTSRGRTVRASRSRSIAKMTRRSRSTRSSKSSQSELQPPSKKARRTRSRKGNTNLQSKSHKRSKSTPSKSKNTAKRRKTSQEREDEDMNFLDSLMS